MSRKMRLPSTGMGRDSLQSRSSITSSSSKLPRSTPLMHSTKKVLPSTSQKVMKRTSYTGGSDHHVMKDTRPLNDKGHMKKCILELLSFLSDMNYPHPLSAKMLSPPTNKEYYRIFEFVYDCISPTYKMMAKPDEEVSKILYDLNYPFSLSRSTLSNIGTMSAWPHALGALHWLTGIVKYHMSVEDVESHDMLFNDDKKKELLSQYIRETYIAFMHGRNEPYEDINSKYSEKVEDVNKDKLEEIEGLKAESKRLKTKLEDIAKTKEEATEMEQRLQSMQQDKKYFHEYFEQFEEYCKSLEKKYEMLEVKLNEVKKIHSNLEEEVKELQLTVTGQEISVADVQKLQIDVSQMENTMKTLERMTKQLEEQYWEKQIERSKMIDKIDPQNVLYMEKCRRLQLIPETAERAEGIDYTLKLDFADVEDSGEKIITVIRPKLMTMKSEYLALVGKLQRERNHSLTKNDQCKEQISDQERLKATLQQEYKKMKEEVDHQIAENERKEEEQKREIQEGKEDIESLKTINSLSIEDVEGQMKIEAEKLTEAETKSAKEEEQFDDFLLLLSEKCLDQKVRIQKKFEEFNNAIKMANEVVFRVLNKNRKIIEEELKTMCQDKYTNKMKEVGRELVEIDAKSETLQKELEGLKSKGSTLGIQKEASHSKEIVS